MSLTETRRKMLKEYLLAYNHYEKDRLVRGAQNRGIFYTETSNEEIYDSLVKFAKFHNIKLHVEPPKVFVKDPTKTAFIEEIDKEGNTVLKKLGEDDLQCEESFLKTLEIEAERLSNKLIRINTLIKLYK